MSLRMRVYVEKYIEKLEYFDYKFWIRGYLRLRSSKRDFDEYEVSKIAWIMKLKRCYVSFQILPYIYIYIAQAFICPNINTNTARKL